MDGLYYNNRCQFNRSPSGQGAKPFYRVQFPTGGKAREHPLVQDPVKIRSRRYSPDGRRFVINTWLGFGSIGIKQTPFSHRLPFMCGLWEIL